MPQVKPVPERFRTVTPHLVIDGAANAIQYYKNAFGAEEIMCSPGPARPRLSLFSSSSAREFRARVCERDRRRFAGLGARSLTRCLSASASGCCPHAGLTLSLTLDGLSEERKA